MKIPFSPPDITQEEIDEVVDTLKSGWLTTGPKTKKFEKEIAEFCHTNMAVGLNSATAAMEMTLRLLGVGSDDEVITCAYTYSASASVITHVGANVVMVDTGKNSYHIDYDAIANAITAKTKVIIPIDIGGVLCDYDKIFEIIEGKKDLFVPSNEIQARFGRVIVLADAAHSIGGTYKGKMSGEIADFTTFSFHAVKNLTTSEGGAVTWNSIDGISDESIYKEYMLLSLHGQSKDALAKTRLGAWEYDIIAPNYKCNMTDVMSSMGLVQLKRYADILKKRKHIIEQYDKLLENLEIETMSHYTETHTSSGHLYLTRLTGKSESYRNEVITKLAERGIASNVHYKPLPMHTAYKNLGFDIKNYPNAFEMYENELSLPLYNLLKDDDIDFIVSNLKNILLEVEV